MRLAHHEVETMGLRFKSKSLLLLMLATALLMTALVRIPQSATILVPWQYGDAMKAALKRHDIPATRHTAGNFNCQYFESVEGKVNKIWLAENLLLDDAKANGYYCEISYRPILPFANWSANAGDDRMVGLQ